MEEIFNRTPIALLSKVLNISSTRQKVIASNIANAMTPGYTRKDVDFGSSLKTAMERTGIQGRRDDERHIPLGRRHGDGISAVIEDGREPTDIEKEMVASAENQIFYSAAAKIIGGNFKALKAVIRGRFTG